MATLPESFTLIISTRASRNYTGGAMHMQDVSISKETEKAVCVKTANDHEVWLPKKAIMVDNSEKRPVYHLAHWFALNDWQNFALYKNCETIAL